MLSDSLSYLHSFMPFAIAFLFGIAAALVLLNVYVALSGLHKPWFKAVPHVDDDNTLMAHWRYDHLRELLNVLIDLRFEMRRPRFARFSMYHYPNDRQRLHDEIIETLNARIHALESYHDPKIRKTLEEEK